MYEELASVRGVVDLSSEAALNEAEAFLTAQGYVVVGRTDTSLSVQRQTAGTTKRPYLRVTAISQPDGGVRVRVMGDDREGVQAREADWVRWSANLPKKEEEETAEAEATSPPKVPLPAPPQVETQNLPEPPPTPTHAPPPVVQESEVARGMKRTVGACLVLALFLVVGLVGCGALVASIDTSKLKSAGGAAGGGDSSGPTSVSVKVSGTRGLTYSGHYGGADSGGTSVDGKVGSGRNEYQIPVRNGVLEFDVVSAVFQKKEAEGTLKVEILADGRVVKQQQTNAQYGVVNVTYSPQTD